jgi:uncharacterized membrane protein YoaT (DUF817 family)
MIIQLNNIFDNLSKLNIIFKFKLIPHWDEISYQLQLKYEVDLHIIHSSLNTCNYSYDNLLMFIYLNYFTTFYNIPLRIVIYISFIPLFFYITITHSVTHHLRKNYLLSSPSSQTTISYISFLFYWNSIFEDLIKSL